MKFDLLATSLNIRMLSPKLKAAFPPVITCATFIRLKSFIKLIIQSIGVQSTIQIHRVKNILICA